MAQQRPDKKKEEEKLVLKQHLELAHGSRRREVPVGTPLIGGHERLCQTLFRERLGAPDYSELSGSQFVRLSQELETLCFPGLRGTQVQRLRDLCLLANSSEKYFFNVTCKEQWLRTVIVSDKASFESALLSTEAIDPTQFIPSITVHSIVVPCHPYWTKLQAVRDEAAREVASKRLYFPSTFLEDALSNQQSLLDLLNEWPEREQQCAILNQLHERDEDEGMTRTFWLITPGDVKPVTCMKSGQFKIGSQAKVNKVSWRGGTFVRKDFQHRKTFITELEVVRRVSHPHVVHSFATDETQHSLFMELLDFDLFDLIFERLRVNGSSKPPFSRQESIDILVQIAKAMTYMHGLAEPVIHGDLKPKNILVSKCEILGDVYQYLVKVADFGSAKILNSSTFSAEGAWTTKYAAPELLEKKLFPQRNVEIEYPKKIDVYSFGIIAFEVLTGLVPYEGVYASHLDLKERVIAGKLRPPLREACRRPNFWNDPDLIELVESCWHQEAALRPEFSKVTEGLESIYNILNQNPRIGAHAFEANGINGAPQNSQNGADVLPPAQEIVAVNHGPQNQNLETHASPRPQANATATTEVSGHKKPKKGFPKRGFPFAKMLGCACISPGNVME